MQKLLLLFIILGSFISLQGQISKTVALSNTGTLSSTLKADELNTITNLIITGTIDARDFKTMRDLMPLLASIDLSGASIAAYSGTEGTSIWNNNNYMVNEVPETAFMFANWQGKSTLSAIVLPSTLESIAQNAFYSCVGLTDIVFPSSVTTIGDDSFSFCSGLTNAIIPSSVTSIGNRVFSSCPTLISVDANNLNYSSLDGVLFDKTKKYLIQCPVSKAGAYKIPATVSMLGEFAFSNCLGLTSLTIPYSVTSIGNYSFNNCSSLTSIDVGCSIPLNLSTSPSAFKGVNKTICTLNVPYGTRALYATANQWKDFTNTVEAANGFSVGATTISVGAEANSTATVTLNANVSWTANSNQSWLTVSPTSGSANTSVTFTAAANTLVTTRSATVTISASGYEPQTVTVIQTGANIPVAITAGNLATVLTMSELASITKLTLTGTIDARDFKTMRDLMPMLAEINLSGASIVAYTGSEGTSIWNNTNYAANTIPETAFVNSNWQGKTTLTSIVFPTTATTIAQNAFYRCTSLAAITFPASVATIGPFAFYGCTSLVGISIPLSVTSIGNGAFRSCTGAASLDVDVANPNYSSLGGLLFDKQKTTLIQCPSPKIGVYTIPNSVTTIAQYAFTTCTGLVSVSIPSSVTSIELGAFELGPALLDVDTANPNYSSLDGVLFDKQKTTLIQCPSPKTGAYAIPTTVSLISRESFWGCSNLTSVTIANSVTTIGRSAFTSCTGLTSVSIPMSVTSIESYAFQNCLNLASINVGRSVPVNLSSSSTVFNNVSKTTCTLNVPYGARSLYATANQWKDFTNIVEAANGFSIVATTASIGAKANSTATVALNANVSWTANSNQSWLTVSPASGSTNATLTFTAAANTSVATRSAIVTISASGYESQTVAVTQAGTNIPVAVTAGSLSTVLTANELASIAKLTLTGTIDARDFKTMRDLMPMLTEINLSGANIVAYTGSEGTSIWSNTNYAANTIPETAFVNSNWQGKTTLTSIVLPTTATSIGYDAFWNCTALSSIVLPNGFTTLEDWAFESCTGLVSITLPSTVTSIKSNAFYNCTGLTTIYANMTVPVNLTTFNNVFYNVNKNNCTLVVPAGSIDLYKVAAQWKDFQYIRDNQTPVANAGIDQVVSEGDVVTLDATASTDADGNALTCIWTAPSGITLSSVTAGKPTFTAPEVTTDTPYTFKLKVNDGILDSPEDQVVVTVKQVNKAPVANAGADQAPNEGSVVTLDATASTDADGNALTYIWTAPSGITLSSSTVGKPTFTAPEVTTDTPYTFKLKVNDGFLDSPEDQVVVTVKQVNKAPVANAGADQVVNEGSVVTLDATASTDADGNALTYLWTAPSGITLSSVTAGKPTFTAPEVTIDTPYTFKLKVNDGILDSQEDQVAVTVKQVNKAPVANAGADQAPNEGSVVTLDATASTDADGNTLTYLWTAPSGITLSLATASQPTFTAPEVTTDTPYTFKLKVNDGILDSPEDQVVVTVKQVNKAPVANAGADQVVNEGSVVTLDATASTDADGNALTYLWTAPSGITLSSVTAGKPTFTAPEVTENKTYTFSLVVNDGVTNSIADEVIITVKRILPSTNNYQVKATDCSCRASNDGKIDITFAKPLAYTVAITGNGYSNTGTVSTSYNLNGLAAGTYNISITAAGFTGYQQNFTVVINQPQDLNVQKVKAANSIVQYTMSGGANYYVSVNDQTVETQANTVNVPLNKGENRISIRTDKVCQGVYEEAIYFDGNDQITLFPNPTDGQITIGVPGKDEELTVEIAALKGDIQYKQTLAVQTDRLVHINVSGLAGGTYLVRVTTKTIQGTVKMLKK